jgi:hypothetical protein
MPLTVAGSLGSGIAVEFRSHDGAIEPTDVHELRFAEVGFHGDLRMVWILSGSAHLDSIRYAQVPRGLKQASAAEPLASGKIYMVEAITSGFWTVPPCHGQAYFAVLEDDRVQVCEWPNQCLPLIGVPGPSERR